MVASRPFDAPEYLELILLVGDAEAALEADVRTVFPEKLGAERVDGPAVNAFRARVKQALETLPDFVRRFVGERERADSPGVDAALDEVADTLDETERLSGARAGKNERRSEGRVDRGALRLRRLVGRNRERLGTEPNIEHSHAANLAARPARRSRNRAPPCFLSRGGGGRWPVATDDQGSSTEPSSFPRRS